MIPQSARTLSLTFIVLISASPSLSLDPENWKSLRDASDSRTYEETAKRFEPQLSRSEYPAVFKALSQDLDTSAVWTKQEPEFRHLRAAIDSLIDRFSQFRPPVESLEASVSEFLDRFPTGQFQFPCPDTKCFNGKPYEVSYEQLENLKDAQAKDFLYRIETVNKLLTEFKKPVLKMNFLGIRNAAKRWELFLRDGRSQYPWEAALNSWDPSIDVHNIQQPPTRQWILLHPELGVELSTHSFKDIKAKQALLVDVIGHTWYRWKDGDNPSAGFDYWGIAAVASFRDDLRPGIGLMAHYGRFINLGVVWRDTNNNGQMFSQSPFFLMGIDLFRFAEYKWPGFEKKIDSLTEGAKRMVSLF